MPKFDKQHIKNHIYTNCQRRFNEKLATKEKRSLKKTPVGFINIFTNKVIQTGEDWESEFYEIIRSKFSKDKGKGKLNTKINSLDNSRIEQQNVCVLPASNLLFLFKENFSF